MSGTTDETLWYKIRYTPIRDVVRGRMTARLDLRRPLEEAALPPQIKQLLRRVLKATRLWRLEQLEVMQELMSHFTEGIASGVPADELVRAFGDENQAAQLIHRAKRRNRALPWHVFHFAAWSTGALFVLYCGYAAYFFAGQPSPRINYVEIVNKTTEKTPVEDRAWTYYRRALTGTDARLRQSLSLVMMNALTENNRAGISQFARAHQSEIAWIRQGSAKSHLGWVIGAKGSGNDPALWPDPRQASANDTDETGEALYVATLPSFSGLKELATMLRADEFAASEAGDGKRLLEDIHATLNLSRQTGENGPLLLSMISLSISEMALQDVERALRENPELIKREDWLALIRRLSTPRVASDLFSFEPELMSFDDMLQRTFTDDGSGNGRFTAEGLKFGLKYIVGDSDGRNELVDKAAGPVAGLIVPSRRKLKEEFTRAVTLANANLKLPLRNADLRGVQEAYSLRHFPINLFVPAYYRSQAAAERTLGHRDGVVTAIALELYRQEHGSYPENLSALVPQLLPEVPADRITGEPIRYLLQAGKPVLYSVGADRKDDEVRITSAPAWDIDDSEIRKGDWVLYPTITQ